MIRFALAFAAACAAPALAGTPLRPLQQEAARTALVAEAEAARRAAQDAAVTQRLTDVLQAEAAVQATRGGGRFDEAKLTAAMDALARSSAAYDAAINRQQATTIAGVQADAAARAARQRLADAVTAWIAEGDALVRAATRAGQGEHVPSARDLKACLDEDCGPVTQRDHAAMVSIGAVGPNFDSAGWSAGDSFTLLPADAPAQARVRTLQATARDATGDPASRDAAPAAPQTFASALQAVLDAYFRPQGNSHDDETFAMAAQDLAAAAARLRPAAEEQRRAAEQSAARQRARKAAEDRLAQTLVDFADQGRAVQRAALLAGRGYELRTSAGELTACRDKQCAPTAGLEAAAFVVIGAYQPGAEKALVAYLAPRERGWSFKLPDGPR